MRLTLKELKTLRVETTEGVHLGHVVDLVLETTGQMVAQYIVKPSKLRSKHYRISRDQVVRFEPDKLIVDHSVRIEVKQKKSQIKGSDPEPVTMRES